MPESFQLKRFKIPTAPSRNISCSGTTLHWPVQNSASWLLWFMKRHQCMWCRGVQRNSLLQCFVVVQSDWIGSLTGWPSTLLVPAHAVWIIFISTLLAWVQKLPKQQVAQLPKQRMLTHCNSQWNAAVDLPSHKDWGGLDMWNKGKRIPFWEELWICRSMEENQLEGPKRPGRPVVKIWKCLTSARRRHMINWSGKDSLHIRPQWEEKHNKWKRWWWWWWWWVPALLTPWLPWVNQELHTEGVDTQALLPGHWRLLPSSSLSLVRHPDKGLTNIEKRLSGAVTRM